MTFVGLRKRVYIHECIPEKTGHSYTKWQADWRVSGGSMAYAITSTDRSAATKASLLDSLGAILDENGVRRYKLIERDCCEDCCIHL